MSWDRSTTGSYNSYVTMWLLPQYPENDGYEDEGCQTGGQKLHMKMAYWYVIQNPTVRKRDTKESN